MSELTTPTTATLSPSSVQLHSKPLMPAHLLPVGRRARWCGVRRTISSTRNPSCLPTSFVSVAVLGGAV